jgi:hypothetical protein
MKLEFSRRIFETYENIEFHENPSDMTQVGSCRQTDRRDETNSRFSRLKYRQRDYVFVVLLEATSFSFKGHHHTKSYVMRRNVGTKCKAIYISMFDLTYKHMFYKIINCKKWNYKM